MPGRAKLALQAAAVAVVALLVALLGWQVVNRNEGRGVADAVAAGRAIEAPDFELPLLDDSGTLSLASLRGKAVVLNFWASWCEPCKEESPRLEAAWQRWRDQGVVIVGIDAQDFRVDARRFVERYGLTYPIVHDGDGSTLGRYGVNGFPETWFVDRDGRLVGERIQGPVSDEQLHGNIVMALEGQ
jgi:cytochrome c biogenesis protein CcmG/thiol:disulfide interchange protein DsbE